MKKLSLIASSFVAGGLLLGSAWTVAQPAPPPAPPPAKIAPPPPPAPLPVKQVEAQIQGAIDAVKNNPAIPKDIRDSVVKRLTAVRGTVGKRMSKVDFSDMDAFEREMEKMGEEIEKEMEGLEEEMEKLGEKLGKDLAKNLGKIDIDVDLDFDDDDDHPGIPMRHGADIDDDDDDMAEAIDDLKDLALKPAQRDQITKLRVDSDKTVAAAKKQLDDLSTKLEAAIANSATPDADIARLVDQISTQEAAIRKARILAWSQARRVLDHAQRKKIEDAAKKKTK